MKITAYLSKHNIAAVDMARALGISPVHFHYIKTGDRPPKLWMVQELHKLTGGKVGLWDWDALTNTPSPTASPAPTSLRC